MRVSSLASMIQSGRQGQFPNVSGTLYHNLMCRHRPISLAIFGEEEPPEEQEAPGLQLGMHWASMWQPGSIPSSAPPLTTSTSAAAAATQLRSPPTLSSGVPAAAGVQPASLTKPDMPAALLLQTSTGSADPGSRSASTGNGWAWSGTAGRQDMTQHASSSATASGAGTTVMPASPTTQTQQQQHHPVPVAQDGDDDWGDWGDSLAAAADGEDGGTAWDSDWTGTQPSSGPTAATPSAALGNTPPDMSAFQQGTWPATEAPGQALGATNSLQNSLSQRPTMGKHLSGFNIPAQLNALAAAPSLVLSTRSSTGTGTVPVVDRSGPISLALFGDDDLELENAPLDLTAPALLLEGPSESASSPHSVSEAARRSSLPGQLAKATAAGTSKPAADVNSTSQFTADADAAAYFAIWTKLMQVHPRKLPMRAACLLHV